MLIATEEDLKYIHWDYVEQLKQQILSLSKGEQDREINWIKNQLSQIDQGTFDVSKNINNPIRFWRNEYKEVLKHFNV